MLLAEAGAVVLAAAISQVAPDRYGNLCRRDEQVIFNCVRGRDTFYLCGSDKFTPDRGYVQYRASTGGKPRMNYPSTLAPARGRFFFRNWPYAGGGESHIRFDNGGYRYVLYSDLARPLAYRTGIAIWKDGRRVSSIRCANSDSRLGWQAYDFLPTEPFQEGLIPGD